MNRNLLQVFFVKFALVALFGYYNNSSAQALAQDNAVVCTASHSGPATGQILQSVGISNVNIGSINNDTSTQLLPGAYTYYSNLTTDVVIAKTSVLTIKTYSGWAGPGPDSQVGVWVDWNNDGDFSDANEFIGVQNNLKGGSSYTYNIIPPAGTSLGAKRLRLRSESNSSPAITAASACSTLVFGETEDYSLNVLDKLAVSDIYKAKSTLYPNPVKNSFSVSLNDNNASISVVDLNGRLLKTFDKSQEKYDISSLKAGVYVVIINNDEKQSFKIIKE